MTNRAFRRQTIFRSAFVFAAAVAAQNAMALDPVFVDHFNNGVVENSDASAGFWTQRNSGGSSTAVEPAAGPLQLTAGGSQFPHGQLSSAVQSSFNFFHTPIVLQASGLNFTSPTGSLNKGILRFVLSSQALGGNDESEYTSDDAIALRLESGNGTPGQYSFALGIKENYPLHNSEYDGFWLVNPIINGSATLPGPIRGFTMAWSPKFYDLSITHDASPTDATQVTDRFTGGVDEFMANWHAPSDPNPITGDTALFVQSQMNNSAANELLTASVGQITVSQLRQAWQGADGANWSDPNNWSDADIHHVNGDDSISSVPNFIGSNIKFGPTASAKTVVVDADYQVGAIVFDSPASYLLAPNGGGTGTLQFDTRFSNTEISVLQGSHTIASPIKMYKDLAITVTPSTSVLTLSGGLLLGDSVPITAINLVKAGAGRVDAASYTANSLTISGGTAKVIPGASSNAPAGVSVIKSLTISGGPSVPTAALDLSNNAMVIDYDGSSPLSAVQQLLAAGLNNGQWNGNGIRSSSAAAAAATSQKTGIAYVEASDLLGPTGGNFFGQTVDGTAVLLQYALFGDANQDHTVDTVDFNLLAANFSGSGKVWRQGDFNYDGIVDTVDFNLLGSNFGGSLAGPALGTLVPEPATFSTILMAGLLIGRRRRRAENFGR
jgi:hypothetical protein